MGRPMPSNNNLIIHDSPVTGSKHKVTYRELLGEVETLATVLTFARLGASHAACVYSL
jgi:hypothetical protein